MWFSTASTYSSSHSSLQNFVFKKPPYFPKLSPFDQNEQEFKIQTNKAPWSIFILNVLFIQKHVLILPP
jgi:hypothetical protein